MAVLVKLADDLICEAGLMVVFVSVNNNQIFCPIKAPVKLVIVVGLVFCTCQIVDPATLGVALLTVRIGIPLAELYSEADIDSKVLLVFALKGTLATGVPLGQAPTLNITWPFIIEFRIDTLA